ncbi:hypothetical protein IF1G_05893 [Cordyceps javanica]|uniref:Uncharacterized protein n=1 Tax=Cordyceps javanica TaxID=43265 RepID=A0A545UZM2_9HYPO|nr:hypothetical protein IF1G_05893 [Cordyceps javanica]
MDGSSGLSKQKRTEACPVRVGRVGRSSVNDAKPLQSGGWLFDKFHTELRRRIVVFHNVCILRHREREGFSELSASYLGQIKSSLMQMEIRREDTPGAFARACVCIFLLAHSRLSIGS